MADGKFDLPDDLLSSKTDVKHLSVKRGEAWGGNGDEKALTGLLDESKEQAIPLSPQWLYAKPIEAKGDTKGVSGEMRAPNSLPQGNSTDANLKDNWRLEGSQDKKDWRKAAPDVESSRRWREEERETGLLGRRDRRKEDRRADVNATRDISSDRWQDNNNRSSGHETRRDNKWSSRWGPDDKEKDSRSEKRTDIEKEEHIEKQSFSVSNRPASERDNDSRDKWRPRHRMEVHAGGSAAYRAAPGFGSERGRVEGSNLRFAPGRGRANINGSLKPTSTSAIGSVPGFSTGTYCYPRGKLLDIYRKLKTVPNTIPDEMEHVTTITQIGAIEPLAFVAPGAEEEAVLGDIWKGKITSGGMLHNSFKDKNGESNDKITAFGGMTSIEGKQSSSVKAEETVESFEKAPVNNNGAEALDTCVSQIVMAEERMRNDCSNAREIGGSSDKVNELKAFENQQVADFSLPKHPNLEDIESAAPLEVGSQLPDDSSSLFDFPSLQQTPSSESLHLRSNDEAHPLEYVIPPEDLSLCYLDPQEAIQGPYLGIDIITWFEQGYFGTDLPVRLSDAPDGSPFQELGEIMPHLKLKSGSVSSPNLITKLELSDDLGGSLAENIPSAASAPDVNGSAVKNDQQWSSSGFEAPSSVNVQSRLPNHDYHSELQYSDDQSLQNFAFQDEEIIFPGRPGSSSGNSLWTPTDIHGSFSKPTSHPSHENECSESSMSTHQDGKLHPFGLLMSELSGNSHLRRAQSSSMASSLGDQSHLIDPLLERDATFANQSSFGVTANQTSFTETWSDDYGRNNLSNPNVHLGSVDARHLSRREQEFNNFDLAENMMSHMLQKEQLKQQNHQSPHPISHTTGFGVEQIPGFALSQSKSSVYQSSVHHPAPDMEHLLELRFQQQRHFELQQQQRLLQQQQQQQQQLRLHQMKLLQQQQQQQQLRQQQQQQQQQQQRQQQLLLEQLLHHQMSDHGYGQSRIDPMRDNLLDQTQLRMRLLHDLQQNSHSSRHLDPSLEQIIQANIGQSALRGRQTDLLDLISRAKHGNMLPSEQHSRFQQGQLQAQQLEALRQQLGMEGERRIVGPWSVDESGHHRTQSAGFKTSDFYQQQQRISSHEEQLSQLKWNHAVQEQHQRGIYEPSSMAFERSMSLPAVVPGMNFDNANACTQGLDLPERRMYPHSTDQLGSFSSGIPSNNRQVSDEYYASHPDVIDSYRSGNNGQVENIWIEKQMQQLHLEAERQRKESEIPRTSADSSIWAQAGGDEENSKQVMMELLNQKLGLQSRHEYRHPVSSSSTQETFWPMSESRSSNLPFHHFPDQEVDANNSFMERPQNSNSSALLQGHMAGVAANEQYNHFGNGERLPRRSNSGALIEEQSFLLGTKEPSLTGYVDMGLIGKSAVDKDLSDLEGKINKRHGSRGMIAMTNSVSEIEDNLAEQAEAAMDCGELPTNAHSRHSSISSAGGNGGIYSYESVLEKSLGEEVSKDRLLSISPKGLDNLHKRPPVSRALSSQDVSSDLASAPYVKQKNSTSLATSDERRRKQPVVIYHPETGIPLNLDKHYRRTASDAAVSETSFIDVLKKPVIPEADAANGPVLESADGAQAGRSGKKKGKKGRQIDPSLLGFKVSSNRILMGEIQRLED